MREKIQQEPVKVPHLTDAVARLLRAGNPHSMMYRKLIAAAQAVGDDLGIRIRQRIETLHPGHVPMGKYNLGICFCGENWGYMRQSLYHPEGYFYRSSVPLSTHGAMHLARALVESGGYDEWVRLRLESMKHWIYQA